MRGARLTRPQSTLTEEVPLSGRGAGPVIVVAVVVSKHVYDRRDCSGEIRCTHR